MRLRQKFLIVLIVVITTFFTLSLFSTDAQIIRSLSDLKQSYLESLIFEEHPEMLLKFKRSVYYKKMMNTKAQDSVRYYYNQFMKKESKLK